MEIKITCKGSGYLPIEKLETFQGNLKTLDKSEFEKLKRSILKHGFAFPVFTWGNYILDGHQRIFVVLYLIAQEGYSIGKIPIVEIEASDKAEAAEKLLILNSRYAKITDDGLYEFLNDMSVDISAMADDLNLPDIDMDKFISGYIEDPGPDGVDNDDSEDPKSDSVECPNCGFDIEV